MNNIFNYICCLGRSKDMIWETVDENQLQN